MAERRSQGSEDTEFLFKVLVIGDPTVGKTSFVQFYVTDTYRRDYKMTVGVDFALKVLPWTDKETVKLQLWDIAGQERFTSMTRVYYKDAHACVIMFDLTNRDTFEHTVRWKQDLDLKHTLSDGSPCPCILLANKSDLSFREVEQDEIEALCKKHDFIGWTETSVKEGTMIHESMRFLIEEMVAKYRNMDHAHGTDIADSGLISLTNPGGKSENGKCPC